MTKTKQKNRKWKPTRCGNCKIVVGPASSCIFCNIRVCYKAECRAKHRDCGRTKSKVWVVIESFVGSVNVKVFLSEEKADRYVDSEKLKNDRATYEVEEHDVE